MKFTFLSLLLPIFTGLNVAAQSPVPAPTQKIKGTFTAQKISAQYQILRVTEKGLLETTIVAPPENAPSILPATATAAEKALQDFKNLQITNKIIKPEAFKKGQIKKIIILGDTGCRLKESDKGDNFQNCMDPKEWPYKKVVDRITKEKPNLILHSGDYHYREQCTPGKPCEKMSPVVGYGWKPWELDFFQPTQSAFKARIPWILTRGNHEDCKRAWLGFDYLLSSNAHLEKCSEYQEPELLLVDGILIINFDSSHIPEALDPDTERAKIWAARMAALNERIEKVKGYDQIWILTHKPISGLVKFQQTLMPVNVNLHKYFEGAAFFSKITLYISGHVHVSHITKAQTGPLSLIVGNGGSAMDDFNSLINPDSIKALGYTQVTAASPGFGYLVMTRKNSKSWNFDFKNSEGQTDFKCQFDIEKKTCVK